MIINENKKINEAVSKSDLNKIESMFSDYESVITEIGSSYIVELSDSDQNNTKLISKLKSLGFKKNNNFRWTYRK